MEKGEIWVSDFWDGNNAVLIGDWVGPNLWNCIYLLKIDEKKYARDPGGRVTGNPFDSSYYTGEGQVIEDAFSQFYHVEEGIEIVPFPEITPETTIPAGKGATWTIYQENP